MTASTLYPLLESPNGKRYAHTEAAMLFRAAVTLYGDSTSPKAVRAMLCELRVPSGYRGGWPLRDGSSVTIHEDNGAVVIMPCFA